MESVIKEYQSGKARFGPNLTIRADDRVIIHGAGKLGREIHRYIRDVTRANIVACVDRRHQELCEDVNSPESVFSRDYDRIIVAIKDENDAEEVRQYYVSGGVSPEKIVVINSSWNYDDVSPLIRSKYKELKYVSWEELHKVTDTYAISKPFCTTSMICNQSFLDMPFAKYWSQKLNHNGCPRYHRKMWEDIFICQSLYERGFLKDSSRGIGFGVGEEPLPDLFASYGCHIMATDLAADASKAKGWIDTGQNAAGDLNRLRKRHFCDDDDFFNRVEYQNVDMNNIPNSLNDFDFCWSTCALEHLGSLKHGMDFIINSMKTLKAGGIAIHTTEYNLYSNDETIETEDLSIYRKKDIIELSNRLKEEGYKVEPIDWFIGNAIYDGFIDLPPYSDKKIHLRLLIDKYPCTSIGLIIRNTRD